MSKSRQQSRQPPRTQPANARSVSVHGFVAVISELAERDFPGTSPVYGWFDKASAAIILSPTPPLYSGLNDDPVWVVR